MDKLGGLDREKCTSYVVTSKEWQLLIVHNHESRVSRYTHGMPINRISALLFPKPKRTQR